MTDRTRCIGMLSIVLALPLAYACGPDPFEPVPEDLLYDPPGPAAAGLSIEPGEVVLRIGETLQLLAETEARDGTPLGGVMEADWTSSNPNIVGVNRDGMVEGHAHGRVTITAVAYDYTAEATVVVLPLGKIDPPVVLERARNR